jgi:hypothetical protein
MNVLVACEESQAVCVALRAKGHNAFSCDLQECSGGYPEWHIVADVLTVINGGTFVTQAGNAVTIEKWGMMIAHPTCTFIANSGVQWLFNKDGSQNEQRWQDMISGCAFFKALLDAPIELKAIENPIPHKYAVELIGRKYDQLIQPYHFGHPESKATCFWLQGLPKLQHTNNVRHIWKALPKSEAQKIFYCPPGPERAKLRSKTFAGIAAAIADQWG